MKNDFDNLQTCPQGPIFNGLIFVKKHLLHNLEQRDIEGIFINKKPQCF